MKPSTSIKRRRLFYAIPAYLIGFSIDVLMRWLIDGTFMFMEAFSAGCLAVVLALAFGERRRGLPTVDDLQEARLKENAAPLGLAAHHSSNHQERTNPL